ncbi:MAG: hypothetical protein WBW53_16325 [Terriglobales bacterium]
MTIRLLLLSLLVSIFVVPVVAQSFPDKNPSSQPRLDGLEFRANVLPLPPNVLAKIGDVNPQLPLRQPLAKSDETCYFIRSYRVVRDSPNSDLTRRAGYSDCQSAARFQVKAAVSSPEIVR